MERNSSEMRAIKSSESTDTLGSSFNLLRKIQTAGKDWDDAPEELLDLQQKLSEAGCDMPWTPKKFGVNLLTPNKVRGMLLKRVLMKLYPFETFWMTESLDETLQKCLLVCQQLKIEQERSIIWGQCSVDASYDFWMRVLGALPKPKSRSSSNRSRHEEDWQQEAKSKVISALVASQGTDWDKRIAQNFEEGLGKNKLPLLMRNCGRLGPAVGGRKHRVRSQVMSNANWRSSFQHVFDTDDNNEAQELEEVDELTVTAVEDGKPNENHALTTTSLSNKLRRESQDMIEALRNIEKYYNDDCVLQIDNAFELGYKVCELADEFQGYMATNNRGAFRDVESLTNHTDKVIRAMSKITMAYQDFFLEFQKYFGRGDEVNIKLPLFPFPDDIMDNQ